MSKAAKLERLAASTTFPAEREEALRRAKEMRETAPEGPSTEARANETEAQRLLRVKEETFWAMKEKEDRLWGPFLTDPSVEAMGFDPVADAFIFRDKSGAEIDRITIKEHRDFKSLEFWAIMEGIYP